MYLNRPHFVKQKCGAYLFSDQIFAIGANFARRCLVRHLSSGAKLITMHADPSLVAPVVQHYCIAHTKLIHAHRTNYTVVIVVTHYMRAISTCIYIYSNESAPAQWHLMKANKQTLHVFKQKATTYLEMNIS